MPHRLLLKHTRKNRGVTLVELLIAAVISGIIISAMIGAFVTTASKSVKEKRLGEIQEENHLALDLISSEIQEAVWISKDSGKLLELPNGRIVLSLLLPDSQGYTLVLYTLAAPSENLSPILQAYLAKNQSTVALYRWQSIPLDVDPKDPIFPNKIAPQSNQPQLVTAFLYSDPDDSEFNFIEDKQNGQIYGGQLILRGDDPTQPCLEARCSNLEIATRSYSRNIHPDAR